MSELNEVLSDTPETVDTPAPEPESAQLEPTQETAAPADNEGETVEESPAEEPKQSHRVPYAELKKERTQRQQLERELAEMRGKVDGLTHQAQPNAEAEQGSTEDDFFADPTGYTSKAIKSELDGVRTEYQQRLFAMSEEWVRSQHSDDYDDAVGAFIDAAKANPALVSQMQASPMPAQTAYEVGKTYLEASKYGGDINTMRAKIKEEVLAELKAEQTKAAATNTPKSLAGARGVGGQFVPQQDDSLEAILGG